MCRQLKVAGIVVLFVHVLVGCDSQFATQIARGWRSSQNPNSPASEMPVPSTELPQSLSQPALPIRHEDPQAVAGGFLAAVKSGDSAATQELLTAAAKAALDAENLQSVAPGNHAAFFHVGSAEYLDDGAASAHVACVWSNGDVSVGNHAFILVLRHEEPGWRVVGIVDQTRSTPAIFNFEEPATLAH